MIVEFSAVKTNWLIDRIFVSRYSVEKEIMKIKSIKNLHPPRYGQRSA